MRRVARTMALLCSVITGCETTASVAPALPLAAAPLADAKWLALQQEREQLLTTLGEFHDRIRDLEAKLADRDNQPAAASYDQLLSAKEAELAELRRLGPEREKLAGQLASATSELAQAHQRIVTLEQQLAARDKDLVALQTHASVVANLDQARHRILELEGQLTRQDHDLRALRTGTAERDSLAAQLQTATTTVDSLKAQVSALDHQLKEREQAYGTLRSRLIERDKLVPQLNAMIAEVYQSRHRIAALEHQLNERNPGQSSRPRTIQPPAEAPRGQAPREAKATAPSTQDPATGFPRRSIDVASLKAELLKVIPSEMVRSALTFAQNGEQILISLAANRLFMNNDAALTREGITLLQRIGGVVGQLAGRVIYVAGHTDNQSIGKDLQKTFPDNKAFSWARAENARRVLVNAGVPANRTKAVGLADTRPIASNTTEQGRQKNRRLELVIAPGPSIASAPDATPSPDSHLAALDPSRPKPAR